ncbi:MAG: hypothetical protein WBP93_03775 [Pyrinomonadaceae bacterium]
MGKTEKKSLTGFFILCLAVAGIGLLSSTWLSAKPQQDGQTRLVAHVNPPDLPVEVLGIKVKGKNIKLDEKFDDNEDWLNGLALKIKNISNKPVVYVGMYLDFPETKATGNIMSFPVSFGQNPLSPIISASAQRLLPDEMASISLDDKKFADLKNFIERRHSISSIHKASIRITTIAFEGGAIWSNGSWMRSDPNNPHRLIPIANQ